MSNCIPGGWPGRNALKGWVPQVRVFHLGILTFRHPALSHIPDCPILQHICSNNFP